MAADLVGLFRGEDAFYSYVGTHKNSTTETKDFKKIAGAGATGTRR